jgi:DNA-binding GntR family transcriptional regulator
MLDKPSCILNQISCIQFSGASMTDSIAAKLHDAIEQDIATGVLPPGARLDEMSLAQRYMASRTPVREALRLLAASGMVELRPRRGAVVAELGPERLYEMFEVMAELEAMCGRLAARRVTPATRQALFAAHEACRAATGDPDAYYLANEAFHQAIYRASGNGVLMEQCLALQKRLRPYRRLQLRVGNRVGRSFAEHEHIVAAIAAGNGAEAMAALTAHVVVQGERFADLVASLASLKAA